VGRNGGVFDMRICLNYYFCAVIRVIAVFA